MSSKYEKSYTHEEEGSYHRREVEPIAPRDDRNYTTHHETSYQIVPTKTDKSSRSLRPSGRVTDTSDDENFEEWTTSKRKINHKTRQVETRVSRQLLVEDGKVIADSGPQVITRIKEDNKLEECEKEKKPKSKSKFDAISCAQEVDESTGRVLGKKKEIQRVSREVREENMQYHDERFKELTGQDVHRRAIQAPHELITINDKSHQASAEQAPRGKMVHYSNKGKKYQDTDEILEVAKLAIDGSITKEVKRTRHHEECSEDELPDEKGEAEALRAEPIATRSSRRHVDYVNDFNDTATPSCSSDDEVEGDPQAIRRYKASKKQHSAPSGSKQHHHVSSSNRAKQDEAFPRYEIDPLLNSLRDEDFRPISSEQRPYSAPKVARSHRPSHGRRDQDASVQVQLSDEEIERRSMRSEGSSVNSHEKQARHLQRQSTRNSSRNYYYGKPKHQRQRAPSVSSTSSSSASSIGDNLKDRQRRKGTKSRDSGFRSPRAQRGQAETPLSRSASPQQHQIYSVSNKAKRPHQDERRPTSPTGSLGQRSVKTTTTTLSAGLEDRPRSRQESRAQTRAPRGSQKVSKPPSPFQKLAKFFSAGSPGQRQSKSKAAMAASH